MAFYSLLPATADTDRLPSSLLPLSVFPGVFLKECSRIREVTAAEIPTPVLVCVHAACFQSMKFPVLADSLFFNFVFFPHASVL